MSLEVDITKCTSFRISDMMIKFKICVIQYSLHDDNFEIYDINSTIILFTIRLRYQLINPSR